MQIVGAGYIVAEHDILAISDRQERDVVGKKQGRAGERVARGIDGDIGSSDLAAIKYYLVSAIRSIWSTEYGVVSNSSRRRGAGLSPICVSAASIPVQQCAGCRHGIGHTQIHFQGVADGNAVGGVV